MSDLDIVFDVGKVLIDYDYERLFRLLNQHGAGIENEEDFARRVDLIGYEQGKFSDADFISRLNGLLLRPLPATAVTAAWNDLFTPITPMLDLARELKNSCGVFLLSNTSGLHWQHLRRVYRLDDVCHDLFASYQVGLMKPAAEIYRTAETRFGLNPASTLFVDDKEVNVAGALACGWQGFRHETPQQSRQRIEYLLAGHA